MHLSATQRNKSLLWIWIHPLRWPLLLYSVLFFVFVEKAKLYFILIIICDYYFPSVIKQHTDKTLVLFFINYFHLEIPSGDNNSKSVVFNTDQRRHNPVCFNYFHKNQYSVTGRIGKPAKRAAFPNIIPISG